MNGFPRIFLTLGLSGIVFLMANCAHRGVKKSEHELLVSVKEQKAILYKKGTPKKIYPVSTSKYGLGHQPGSYRTPLGKMVVARKIGGNQPKGMVFKSRRPTGEIVGPNAPGRDPIVSRILWLAGGERENANTFGRFIYIHGTPEEDNIGKPASYGCIRMTSDDVIDLHDNIGEGTVVRVIKGSLPMHFSLMSERRKIDDEASRSVLAWRRNQNRLGDEES